MSALLLTYADKAQQELLELVSPHYLAWAEGHGYDFISDHKVELPENRAAHWMKIALLRDLLPEYEFILWCDADFVLLGESDPRSEIMEEDFQGLVMEQRWHGIGPNTGFWLLRSGPEAIEFVEATWQKGPIEGASLNDQATVAHLLGFSYLPYYTKPIAPSKWLAGTAWIDARWNMLSFDHPEASLIAKGIHYGGLPLQQKIALISQQLVERRREGWQRDLSPEDQTILQASLTEAFIHPNNAQ